MRDTPGATIRIARPRHGLPPVVYGNWIVGPEEWPHSDKAAHIRYVLSELRAEEPEAGWRIESRGTHSGWHPVED